MTTVFPSAIDAFDIRSPQEIIRANHVNDIQEAIVSIEVFLLSLEESFNNHVSQLVDAHDASAISVASTPTLTGGVYPITATQVQTALEQIKTALEQIEADNADVSDFADHLDEDINDAHDGQLLGSKIATGVITTSHLAFDPATQAELDAHASEDINTAHSVGSLLGSRIADGTIPDAKLVEDYALDSDLTAHINDTTAAHQASTIEVSPTINGTDNVQDALASLDGISDAHIAATTGVHGVSSGLTSGDGYANSTLNTPNAVVGRLDTQRLENKRMISDLVGTKILLFTDEAEELEKEVFAPISESIGDTQLHVRNPAGSRATNTVTLTGTVMVIPVVSSSLFSVTNVVRVYPSPGYSLGSSFSGTVTDVPDSTSVEITFTSSVGVAANSLIINETIPNPLFAIESDGTVSIYNLNVQNASVTDISFDDNVIIDGNFTVTGTTILGDGDTTSINGTLVVTGTGSVTSNFSIGGQLTTNSLVNNGNLNNSGTLTVNGVTTLNANTIIGSDLIVQGNIFVDGYLDLGSTVVATGFIATSGLYNDIDLPQFKDDFDNHLPELSVVLGGFKHHTDNLAYSSLRHIATEFPVSQLGVVEVAHIIENFNPIDGYLVVDDPGVLEVGDEIVVGDNFQGFDGYGVFPWSSYQGRTIVGIDKDTFSNPVIYLNDTTDLDLLSVAYDPRIVSSISYLDGSEDSLSKIVDALAIDIYNHSRRDLPTPTHTASSISSVAFSGVTSTNVQDALEEIQANVQGSSISQQNSLYTAVANDKILADTSGGSFTINLPATPILGDVVMILDAAAGFAANPLTVGRNGENIQGSASDFIIGTNNAWAEFVYNNASRGWEVRV